jgi:transcriptional regulator with XRE-family HTH domain
MVGRLIRERRLAKGYSQEALADVYGTTQRQITRWEQYTTQMPRVFQRDKLGAILDIAPAEWHLAAATAIEAQAPAKIHLLTEDELFSRFGIRRYEEPQSGDGLRYSAGPSGGVVQGIDDTLPRRIKGSKYLWEAPVVGDCMESEIHSGEIVIYSTRAPIEIGRIVVALRDEDELLIKRLRLAGERQVLRPNRGEDVPVDERIRFLGRGVAVQRPL